MPHQTNYVLWLRTLSYVLSMCLNIALIYFIILLQIYSTKLQSIVNLIKIYRFS